MLTEHGQPETSQQWIDHHLLHCNRQRPYAAHDTSHHHDPDEPVMIDDAIGHNGQSYTYHRVVVTGRHTVRARIKRDVHAFQSYALAEVLTPELTWTVLAETTPSDLLLTRARAILS